MPDIDDLQIHVGYDVEDVRRGLEALVQAGIRCEEIMNGAGHAVAELARAGEVDTEDAAAIVADVMQRFSIGGPAMGHIADVIAGAKHATPIDVAIEDLKHERGGHA